MTMNAVIARCAEISPVTVMTRLALQFALSPSWLDKLFEREGGTQYQQNLFFSTVVELMSVVAVGARPSLSAAAQAYPNLPVSLQALYDKIKHTELDLIRALVTDSAARLSDVLAPIIEHKAPIVPGYRVRIVDGSHLRATERRLKPLRGHVDAPLPGHSLIVFDPDLGMAIDIEPCDDAYTQERAVMSSLLDRATPGELWIADSTFSTRAILGKWDQRGCAFIVREHGSTPNPEPLGEATYQECVDSGDVYEQAVKFEDKKTGYTARLRRVELHLTKPTGDGDKVLRILTNLPKQHFKAGAVANLYRRRWTIESMFQRLEADLHSEVKTLAHPRAALLAFGIAVLAYNVLSVIKTAVWEAKDMEGGDIELSSYYIAVDVRANYAGMMMAVPVSGWRQYDAIGAPKLRRLLLEIAAHTNPKTLRKHPRGPKPAKKKTEVSPAERRGHVSTARALKDGFIHQDL